MTQPYVNKFYRVWFTIVDPIVCLLTAVTCIASPETMLDSLIPAEIVPYSQVAHGPLLYQTAAMFGFMAITFEVLLRATSDPKIWKIIQAAVLGVDVAILGTFYVALKQQNRLAFQDWRGADWSNAGITLWVTGVRAAFLLGLGSDAESKAKKI